MCIVLCLTQPCPADDGHLWPEGGGVEQKVCRLATGLQMHAVGRILLEGRKNIQNLKILTVCSCSMPPPSPWPQRARRPRISRPAMNFSNYYFSKKEKKTINLFHALSVGAVAVVVAVDSVCSSSVTRCTVHRSIPS